MATDPESHDSGPDATILAFPVRERDVDNTATPEPPLKDVVGDVLRNERQRQGRTLVDVAERAAVAVSYLSEVERGRKDVSSEVLDAVVGALDITLVDVLDRAAERLRLGAGRTDGRPMMLAA